LINKNPSLLLFYICISFVLIWIALTWYHSWGLRQSPEIDNICSIFANLVFCLPFSFCNLVFAFCFCIVILFWSNRITLRRYLFSFCDIYSFLQYSILFFATFVFCISLFVDYDYWKIWFALVCMCEVRWKELFVLELCNEKFS
jgi:hypothetical protein